MSDDSYMVDPSLAIEDDDLHRILKENTTTAKFPDPGFCAGLPGGEKYHIHPT